MSQTLRAILFGLATLCFGLAAVFPQHGRLIAVGLTLFAAVFAADAIDAA